MPDRRAFLAGSAGALAAFAGCSSLPVGGGDPQLGFDPSSLQTDQLSTVPDRPTAYPSPVPGDLEAAHRRRIESLLAGVPTDPSLSNESMTAWLSRERAEVVEDLNERAEGPPTERLGEWRYTRAEAATVRGAYDAARGAADRAELTRRRREIRRELATFGAEWDYPGEDALDALAVAHELEGLGQRCRRYVAPDQPFPERPTAEVRTVGDLAAGVERARATLDDLTGLAAAHREATPATEGHRETLSVLAGRVARARRVTEGEYGQLLRDDPTADAFGRDVEDLPAEELFVDANYTARRLLDGAREAEDRVNPARTVVLGGWAIVALLAVSTIVEAIEDGAYGMPGSAEAVRDRRDAAVSALQTARGLDPKPVGGLLAVPAWERLERVAEVAGDHDGALSEHDVVRTTASLALAEHLANAVPAVTDRVAAELPDS